MHMVIPLFLYPPPFSFVSHQEKNMEDEVPLEQRLAANPQSTTVGTKISWFLLSIIMILRD